MPTLRSNVGPLIDRAIDSITLSIELFNRPSEIGRAHAVLILLHHAFEMLLKATVLQRTGAIHASGEKFTYGFDKCLTLCNDSLKVIDTDERATLSILDALRDQSTHYYCDVSEDILYINAQAGVTLFSKLLRTSFGISLLKRIPGRVLPISTHPPRDLALLFDSELAEIDRLLGQGKRQGARAAAKLRTVLAFVTGAREDTHRVSEQELSTAVAKRRRGKEWTVIFPEVAQLKLSTEGSGIPITMRITKDAPLAVRVAKPGDEVMGTLIKQEVNLWDTFNLSRDDLAAKLGLTAPRTHALIFELGIQTDPACYRELRKKSVLFKGYSKKALEKLRDAKELVDLDQVWKKHRHKLGAVRKQADG